MVTSEQNAAQKTFVGPRALSKEIQSVKEAQSDEKIVVGIDGRDGAGKSFLAKKLGLLLGLPVVDLDDIDYLVEGQGSFVRSLRCAAIRERLEKEESGAVVAGICLLNACDHCDFAVDLLLYVKRYDRYGVWEHADECAPEQDSEEVIRILREEIAQFAKIDAEIEGERSSGTDWSLETRDPLREEIIRYHANYQPIARADYIFENHVISLTVPHTRSSKN